MFQLWRENESQMIFLVLLAGYYLVMAVGTYKMLLRKSAVTLADDLNDNPWAVYTGIAIISSVWFLGVSWSLVKEAVR